MTAQPPAREPVIRAFRLSDDYVLLARGEEEAFRNSYPGRPFPESHVPHRIRALERGALIALTLVGEGPIGYVMGSLRRYDDVVEGYIDSIFVAPEARSAANAARLLRAMEERFKGQGASAMTLDVTVGNERAVRAFESYGFRALRKAMGKPIT